MIDQNIRINNICYEIDWLIENLQAGTNITRVEIIQKLEQLQDRLWEMKE